jgi:hypothetical protein
MSFEENPIQPEKQEYLKLIFFNSLKHLSEEGKNLIQETPKELEEAKLKEV